MPELGAIADVLLRANTKIWLLEASVIYTSSKESTSMFSGKISVPSGPLDALIIGLIKTPSLENFCTLSPMQYHKGWAIGAKSRKA